MIPEKRRFRFQAEFCKSLAHPVRLEIIERLRKGGRTVQELADLIGVKQANLSQHLALLRHRGVVRGSRDGVNVTYTLTNPKIGEACDLIREILGELTDAQRSVIFAGS